jgi:hypothetical protein
MCESKTSETIEHKPARYRGELVDIPHKLYRCESCKEEFVTPEQMRDNVRAVKNEIRKKYGLLSPERIREIRVVR